MVKRVPKGSKGGGQFSPLNKGKKAPTADKKGTQTIAKKSKTNGNSIKKTHLTNEEVKKQIDEAYKDRNEAIRKIRNENIILVNTLEAEEKSNLKVLLEANQGFINFFRRGFYDRKSSRRIMDICLEVEDEEKRVIHKIYDNFEYKMLPKMEAQYNNGQGLRYTSREDDEDSHSSSRSSHESGSAWLS